MDFIINTIQKEDQTYALLHAEINSTVLKVNATHAILDASNALALLIPNAPYVMFQWKEFSKLELTFVNAVVDSVLMKKKKDANAVAILFVQIVILIILLNV